MKLNLPKPNTVRPHNGTSYPNNLRTIESVRSFKKEVNRFYENEG